MTRPLLVLDTETTGLADYKLPADHPQQPRIASIALLLCAPCGRIVSTHFALIKPDGWTMPTEPGSAGAVNGLTTEFLARHGRPIVTSLQVWNRMLDLGPLVIAHNAKFDCKLVRGELRRAGMPDRFDATETYCTMRNATAVVRLPPTDKMLARGMDKMFKPPGLAECLRHFCDQEPSGAHDALHDALDCRRIYLALQAQASAPAQRANDNTVLAAG